MADDKAASVPAPFFVRVLQERENLSGDIAERLNHRLSPAILLVMSLIGVRVGPFYILTLPDPLIVVFRVRFAEPAWCDGAAVT